MKYIHFIIDIIIYDMEYSFVKCLETNYVLRSSFNELALKTFALTFEEWYQDGYWSSKYQTYSHFLNNRVIANASASRIKFDCGDKIVNALQIGTVMTDIDFRSNGLASELIKTILDEWTSKSDLIYLYANDESVSFYPKFGFERMCEYTYSCPVSSLAQNSVSYRKLDLSIAEDYDLLCHKYAQNNPFSAIRMLDSFELLMFYCGSIFSDSIYYLEKYELLVILQPEGKELHCFDIYGEASCSLEELMACLPSIQPKIEAIGLGFTPIESDLFTKAPILDYDNLFVLKGLESSGLFDEKQLILPLLSHA